jgi:hypothetical protein
MGVVDKNGNAKGSIKRALSLNARAGQEGNLPLHIQQLHDPQNL